MCGRFVRSFTVEELIEEMNVAVPSVTVLNHLSDVLEPNFNLPPTLQIPVVTTDGRHLVIEEVRWGFDVGNASRLVINARAESVTEKPMFRGLLKAHRCAVPMEGFYEWQRQGTHKIPFYVHREDHQRMWVAGLWRQLSDGTKQVVLLTHEAEGVLSNVHHRSPCQLSLEDAVDWTVDDPPHFEMLSPSAGPALELHRVSSNVNSIRNNDASLLQHVDGDDGGQELQLGLFD